MGVFLQLGGDPDLFARNARVLDALANLMLVAIGKGSVNVSVACLKRSLYSLADLIGLGLPSSQANGGNLVAGVESVGLLGVVGHCGGVLGRRKIKKRK